MLLTSMNINQLIDMNEDDLRELLVKENTNSQELRELIYRLKRELVLYKSHLKYLQEENERLTEMLE